MNAKQLNSEKGQAIVYLVLGLVVFLGFVAMAIDGGMALADRRHEQNAADAASLAGGGKAAIDLENYGMTTSDWSCGNAQFAMNNGEYAAIQRAHANNFTITDPYPSPCNYNCVIATCSNAGKYIDVSVEISATTQSNFLQLVFPNALHNEVKAGTRIYPGYPAGFGNAIVALDDSACTEPGKEGGIFYSNPGSEINIYGGGVISNGCLRQNGNITVTIDNGDVLYHQPWNLDPEDWDPDPEPTSLIVKPSDFGVPFTVTCPSLTKATDLEKDLSKKPVTLPEGLTCITGNLSINAGDQLSGTDVTILMVDGKLTINGGASINLSAPPEGATKGIPGVLIYVPSPEPFDPSVCPIKKQEVSLNGNEESIFHGTVLAPCSTITLNGTGGNSYEGQVVGWNVYIGGDATLELTYKRNPLFDQPASMELHR